MEKAAREAQQGDIALAQFLSSLESAAQQYINAKV
jgi:hypothetical protein